jgi:hypothetical protein
VDNLIWTTRASGERGSGEIPPDVSVLCMLRTKEGQRDETRDEHRHRGKYRQPSALRDSRRGISRVDPVRGGGARLRRGLYA